ncbi:MAG: DUF2970 domain-containing protein [Paraburkholderia sp.]|uniref:DUF2970 domain-containing protein n=1 Tax=Paraburkholderia sp. TaxID=1926495 RepID=UPI001225542E|nr:DUF2970 domain-containing protein [Paraburkholderia sp.]TAL99926.1 MAG: DUF2970 domain-containing protein [Paraburkholderia sp.]TAM30510.1 MAG: DUF2970 domain-containing protein [Paraburkholderia sp.]
MNGGTDGEGGAGKKKSGVLQLCRAIAWSFMGVRKRADLESDAAQLHPLALIIAGLLGAAIFVGVLLLVVHAVAG